MKTLATLLGNIDYCEIKGSPEIGIDRIEFDSRKIKHSEEEGVTTLYVAQRGTQTDGHLYIPQAVEKRVSKGPKGTKGVFLILATN